MKKQVIVILDVLSLSGFSADFQQIFIFGWNMSLKQKVNNKLLKAF